MNWRDKFTNFMYGRYGVDQLSRFMLVVIFILCVLSLFIKGSFMSLLILVLIILTYYRMFSKNINKRYQENEAFLRRQFYVSEWWKKWKFRYQESRKYHIYRCPNCKQKVRVPRGRGRISIHCPKCGTDFIKKSWQNRE